MGKANLTVNRLLERKNIFADFINGTLFCGEQVLKESDLTLLSGHSGIIAEQAPGKKTGRRSEPNEIGPDMSGQDKMNQPKADTGKTGWDGPEPGHRRTCDRTFTGKLGAFERYGDIRMEAEFSTYSVIFAHETQQHVHYAMPVRSMMYEAMEYVRQVQELEKQHLAKGEKLRSDEFLSGLTKEDHLKPVVSVVTVSRRRLGRLQKLV